MLPEADVTVTGPGVHLEGRLTVEPGASTGVVVCHPHPLYGGDMDSAVVVATASACRAQGLGTLRFNFRGVGASDGVHDEGRGELDDAEAAIETLAAALAAPGAVALAGYSFGAAVAARVAARRRGLAGLLLIAPPLAMLDVAGVALSAVAGPVLVVAGGRDEYCPADALERLGLTDPDSIKVLTHGDHFFSTTLDALVDAVRGWAGALRAGQAGGRRGAG